MEAEHTLCEPPEGNMFEINKVLRLPLEENTQEKQQF